MTQAAGTNFNTTRKVKVIYQTAAKGLSFIVSEPSLLSQASPPNNKYKARASQAIDNVKQLMEVGMHFIVFLSSWSSFEQNDLLKVMLE